MRACRACVGMSSPEHETVSDVGSIGFVQLRLRVNPARNRGSFTSWVRRADSELLEAVIE